MLVHWQLGLEGVGLHAPVGLGGGVLVHGRRRVGEGGAGLAVGGQVHGGAAHVGGASGRGGVVAAILGSVRWHGTGVFKPGRIHTTHCNYP